MRRHLFILVAFGAFLFSTPCRIQAQVAESYEALMKAGNEKFAGKDFISAKTYYEMALKQRKEDPTAQKKLTETLEKIKEDNQKQELFYGFLDAGDMLYGRNMLEDALTQYEKALEIFPDDKYVNSKAEEIRNIMQEHKAKLEAYQQAMRQGDDLMERENYEAALMQYQEASKIFPNESSPKEKIAEARQQQLLYDEKMSSFDRLKDDAALLARRKQYQTALDKLTQALELFPDDEEAKQLYATLSSQKQSYDAYNNVIVQADKAYEEKDYNNARRLYQEATTHLADDPYALDMIQRINAVFESPEYLAEQNYHAAIEKARSQEAQQQLSMALSSYQEALGYKPNDDLCIQKIDALTAALETERLLAEVEQQFQNLMRQGEASETASNWNDALSYYLEAAELKPENEQARVKVNAIQQRLQAILDADNSYQAAIAQGDAAFQAKSYDAAITAYENALAVKPGESYPQQQIEASRRGIEELAQAAAQQALNDSYQTAIAQGDAAFQAKSYDAAIAAYENALTIKPGESYPQQQIEAARRGIEELAQAAAQQALDNSYQAAIAQGDAAFQAKSYDAAIAAYENALTIKPGESYPQQQIEASRRGIEELAQAAAQQALDNSYQAAIAQGDAAFQAKSYDAAIAAYENALTIKPGESYPQQQIEASRRGIEELAQAAALEEQRQQQIAALLAEGDALFVDKAYSEATSKYEAVIQMEPNNTKALTRLSEIEHALAQEAALRQQLYDEAMASAQRHMEAEEYADAIAQYDIALNNKADDAAALTGKDTAQKLEDARLAILRNQYNGFIKEADVHFKAKTYDKAVEFYTKADEVGLGEPYPSEMLARISQIIEENKMFELNKEPLMVASGQPQRFSFTPIEIGVRRNNYIIMRIKNLDEGESFPLIVSFGNGEVKHGGFVLPISESGEYKDYIIRIGAQYKWFSEDNTWIEVTSEKGHVEIGKVEISKSN